MIFLCVCACVFSFDGLGGGVTHYVRAPANTKCLREIVPGNACTAS